MSTNLIQNYIASKNVPAQTAPKKPMPDFNIQRELDNRTFIKPLNGKGKLVNGNIFMAPQQMISGLGYNLRALKHAASGRANDHELGKINDIGLVGGGAAIASYLATKRFTPMTKGMEFVGFGAFLASMALWPKLAIQLPAYLIHGVNVQKQYQDSFGRKKPFYQDPQFIPWDLYTDEQIQKIGDRMGVDKNMLNRRDFIQEKMRKLAVQNNTLWMMTAGFATPVMTALACDTLKPYLEKRSNNITNKKADKILQNIDKHSEKYKSQTIENKLKELIREYNGKQIDDKLTSSIYEIFTEDIDAVTSESLKKDLKKILDNDKFSINESTAKNISKNLKNMLEKKNYSTEFIEAAIPSEEEFVNLFKNSDYIKETQKVDFQKLKNIISREIDTRISNFNSAHPAAKEDAKAIRAFIFGKQSKINPLIKELTSFKSAIFDSAVTEKLINAAKIFDDFRAHKLALDEYALLKVGAAPETVIANYWNNVSGDLLKNLHITNKELEKVRFDRNLVGKLLREKIEAIASNDASYNKFMTTLVEKVASLNSQIKSSDITSDLLNSQTEKTTYEKAVDTVFDKFASSMREKGFSKTASALAGNGSDEFGTAKAIQKAYAKERLLGVKCSFYRLINALDFYRRVATDPNKFKPYNDQLPREVLEELIELCKIDTLSGHSSDQATKFYMLRNPNPERDFSPLEVENGKIKNKFYGKAKYGTTDIPGDKTFYQHAMKFMFEDDMHPDTKSILEKSILKDEISNYRKQILEKIGGQDYFWKPRHRVRPKNNTGSDIKFLLTGIAPDELIFKRGQQAFNSGKWFRIFGGFGAGLLGVTVLTQFFLGKLKPVEVKK